METADFFLLISTTVTLLTGLGIAFFIRFSVRREVESRLANQSTEDKLAASRQLAIIGALSGGITYRLDSTLRALHELLRVLQTSSKDQNVVAELSGVISQLLNEAIAVSNRVCQVTYPDRLELSPQPAAHMLSNLTRGLSKPSEAVIEIADSSHDDVIYVNLHLFQQVIDNVLKNSLDALNEFGGQVKIALTNLEKKNQESGKGNHQMEDRAGQLQIKISDNGIGMDPNTLNQISSFSVSDETSIFNANGLGIPLSFAIMQMLQGSFEITSEFGAGTIVTLTFPLASGRVGSETIGQGLQAHSTETRTPVLSNIQVGRA